MCALRKLEGHTGELGFCILLRELRLSLQLLDKRQKLLLRYASYLNGDYIPLSLVATLLHESDSEKILAVLQPIATCKLASVVKSGNQLLGM